MGEPVLPFSVQKERRNDMRTLSLIHLKGGVAYGK